jgi:hypothetical protein
MVRTMFINVDCVTKRYNPDFGIQNIVQNNYCLAITPNIAGGRKVN